MENELLSDVEIPTWWVRGIVGRVFLQKNKYDVFLVDLGYTITAKRENLWIIPKTLISEDHLTSTVGIYGLLPSLRTSDSSEKETR